VTSASQDGIQNARRNHVSNVEFINAKVEDFAVDFHDRKQKADTIIVDPPRDGMHPDACRLIQEFEAGEIIYVSCNPSTLVRDLQILMGITSTDE
jgi:23S rRNA (uracil1939-C5)-methyltransferase